MKALDTFGIKSFESIKAPLLTPSHVEKRLIYCSRYENLTVEDWTRWTFSDECSVHLDCAEGIQRFLITKEQRFDPFLSPGDVRGAEGN